MNSSEVYGETNNSTLKNAIERLEGTNSIFMIELCNFLKEINESIKKTNNNTFYIQIKKGNLYFVSNNKTTGKIKDIENKDLEGYNFIKKLIENTLGGNNVEVETEINEEKISFMTKLKDTNIENLKESTLKTVNEIKKTS